MLRITTRQSGNNGQTHCVLKLEGRITGLWIDEVGNASRRALDGASALTLDLAGVTFVDQRGVALLAQLVRRGARLAGCSPFVTEQLRARAGLVPERGSEPIRRSV